MSDGTIGATTAAVPLVHGQQVVYTAIMGGYEKLTEQPLARESDIPFVCITDDPGLTSSTWQVVVVEPSFPLDHVRSARRVKILGHEALGAAAETLWIDNRIELVTPPRVIFEKWLADVDLAMPSHSFRDDLLDEFRAVIDGGYDDPARIYEQLWHYTRLMPHILDRKPLWTAILARRRSDAVERAMTTWYEHVLRYSRRDQLSVLAALDNYGGSLGIREIDNLGSSHHIWHDHGTVRRRDDRNARAFRDALAPPVARFRDLESRFETYREGLESCLEERVRLDDELRSAQARLSEIETRILPPLRSALAERESDVAALRSSTSWRVTAPLRFASTVVRSARGRH